MRASVQPAPAPPLVVPFALAAFAWEKPPPPDLQTLETRAEALRLELGGEPETIYSTFVGEPPDVWPELPRGWLADFISAISAAVRSR